MDSTFSTLPFLIFGFSIAFYALLVQSQLQKSPATVESPSSPPPPPPPSPPPLLPPPPPSLPPIESPSPPGSPSPPPPPPRTPQTNQVGRKEPKMKRSASPPNHHHPADQMNTGKKVGLLFVGIAVILQIGVAGFLVFKRRQLLKSKDRYETCS